MIYGVEFLERIQTIPLGVGLDVTLPPVSQIKETKGQEDLILILVVVILTAFVPQNIVI